MSEENNFDLNETEQALFDGLLDFKGVKYGEDQSKAVRLQKRVVGLNAEFLALHEMSSLKDKYRLSAKECFTKILAQGFDLVALLDTLPSRFIPSYQDALTTPAITPIEFIHLAVDGTLPPDLQKQKDAEKEGDE